MPLSAHLAPVAPELVLILGALGLLLAGAIYGQRAAVAITAGAVVVIALAGVVALTAGVPTGTTFNGAFVVDGFARFMKVAVAIAAAGTLVISTDYLRRAEAESFEYPVLVTLSTVGMFATVSANDLMSLYLSFELMSLPLYVLAAVDRDNARATEAGLKYFVLGALSSGMLLYGASLIYGSTGATGFPAIAAAVGTGGGSTAAVFGLAFLMAGLAFKVSAVPFHMWTPDVYEGAPTPVTAFFAAAPKVAAMALMTRVLTEAFPGVTAQWRPIVMFIAVGSMLLGSFAAIGQTSLKRLMAYSSIGHVGYALVGLAAGTVEGAQSVAVYMAIYLAMTLGTFGCLLALRSRQGGFVDRIDDLAGLSRTRPGLAFVMLVLMFSLAGVPPFAGFFGKLEVFRAAVNAGLAPLAVVGVVASVIGAYYYLRIVKIIYVDEPRLSFEPAPGIVMAVLAVASLLVFIHIGLHDALLGAAQAAARPLFAARLPL